MLRLDFREQPVAHAEEHDGGDEHGDAFEDFPSGSGVREQPFEEQGGYDAGGKCPPHRAGDDFLFVTMAAFVDVGDDGSDDEQRFQPFAQDDGEAGEEEGDTGGAAAEHIHRLVHVDGEGGDFGLDGGFILASVHQANEFGEVAFQFRFEGGIAGADGVFHAARLKNIEVGILHLADRFFHISRLIGRLRPAQSSEELTAYRRPVLAALGSSGGIIRSHGGDPCSASCTSSSSVVTL